MDNYLSLLVRERIEPKEKIYFSWSIGYGEETSPSLDRFFPLKEEANQTQLFNY